MSSEPWDTFVRLAITIGITAFLVSVSSSLEKIAKALTRLADDRDPRRGDRIEGGPPAV